jgi:uncharacterized protein YjbI with pentapeptide repeats
MQSINRSVNTSFHVISDPTDVENLNTRIEENRLFLDELKANKPFQNLLFLMHKAAVSEQRLLNFLMGNASLEECFGEKKWMTNLLVQPYSNFEVNWTGSHFLPASLATTFSAIFKQGYFESAVKSHSKMCVLMGSIKRDDRLEKLDLAFTNNFFADLSCANMSGMDLSQADFAYANFSGANLSRANLGQAGLWRAKLSFTYLFQADLTCAYLPKAALTGASLREANLSKANLAGANLTKANLCRANLTRANFSKANLFKSNFLEADLSGANLSGANMKSTKIMPNQLLNVKLIGAASDNKDISAIIKKQEKTEEVFKKYQLLSQIIGEFTFEGTPFPVELTNTIGHNLI